MASSSATSTRNSVAFALGLCACGASPGAAEIELEIESAQSWEAADALFRADPRWLGGDGALSIPLDAERTLWLFGDSFIATSPANNRNESEMVRNTLAVQQGFNPADAEIQFAWRNEADASPGPFFADEGPLWLWPGHGIRLEEGPLVMFLIAVRATPDEGLGFTEAGYRVVVVEDPDRPPNAWELQWFSPGAPAADPEVSLGTAVVRDGDSLYAVATANGSTHTGWLARFSVAEILSGRVVPAWWVGGKREWLSTQALGSNAPAAIVDDVGAENSVHFEPRARAYLHVFSRGFGATTIAARTASKITGPWGDPVDLFTPPESRGPDPLVYAAKAHPELTTGDARDLVITYATNAFDFADLFTEQGQTELYYPRFVTLRFRE